MSAAMARKTTPSRRDREIQAQVRIAAAMERVTAAEKRRPRTPFTLRLWHTLLAGIVGTIGGIYAFGWLYDNMPSTGTKISLYITAGLVGLVAIITVICSLGALDASWRNGLGDPWTRPDRS